MKRFFAIFLLLCAAAQLHAAQLAPYGMDANGQATIAKAGDTISVAANVDNVVHPLAVVAGVDYMTPGATALYTVPAGKSCIVTSVIIRATAAAGTIIIAASGSVGTESATYANIQSITQFTGLSSVGKVFRLNMSGLYSVAGPGDVIRGKITTAATGMSVLTCEVTVMGYLY